MILLSSHQDFIRNLKLSRAGGLLRGVLAVVLVVLVAAVGFRLGIQRNY